MAYCYRHQSRETGVSCSGCGRPICTDCMRPSPVGMRCPECGQTNKQPKLDRSRLAPSDERPVATLTLIALCVVAFFLSGGLTGGNSLFQEGGLFGPAVEAGQYWRLISYGFLHAGLLHIFFNMLLLWFLGSEIERELGSARFLTIYFVAMVGGAAGALLLSPDSLTVGASGAVYGLMGAAAIILLLRGINPLKTGIGALIIINLLISFAIPGISIGGHLGGLIFGSAAGAALAFGEERNQPMLGYLASVVILSLAIAGSLAFA